MVKNCIRSCNKWCLAPFSVFLFIAYTVCTNLINPIDQCIYNYIIQIMYPIITVIFKGISICGTFLFMFCITGIVFYKNQKVAKILFTHLIISDFVNFVIKMIFLRQRPDILRLVEIDGYSFPSGHAMVSFCFYGLCMYFIIHSNFKYKLSISIFLGLLVILIGISRIYLGVHYFSDVLAGFSLGFSYLLLIISLLKHKLF